MVLQIKDITRKLIKNLYSLIRLEEIAWLEIIRKIKENKSKLHYKSVT